MKHSVELLKQLLDYDPESGAFTWKHRPRELFTSDAQAKRWNGRYAGKEAFPLDISQGYRRGEIVGWKLTASRAAWAIHYGEPPDGVMDHINGDRSDNRIENLRVVTMAENMKNQRLSKKNRSGVTGVFPLSNGTFRVTIGGGPTRLGTFPTLEEAKAVRLKAEREFGYHENHGRALFVKKTSA
jgi:hypothetical protein